MARYVCATALSGVKMLLIKVQFDKNAIGSAIWNSTGELSMLNSQN